MDGVGYIRGNKVATLETVNVPIEATNARMLPGISKEPRHFGHCGNGYYQSPVVALDRGDGKGEEHVSARSILVKREYNSLYPVECSISRV